MAGRHQKGAENHLGMHAKGYTRPSLRELPFQRRSMTASRKLLGGRRPETAATVTGTISPVRLDGFGGGFGSPGACPEAFGNCAPDTTVRESRNARAAGRSQRQPHRVWLSTRSAASTYSQTYC